MRIQLPDVNVLIALHDETHEGHERAHRWFASEGRLGWATCPLTENGFIRIFSQPALPNNVGSPAEAMSYLEDMLTAHGATHHFWPDSVSLCDRILFLPGAIAGHRQVTDVYLLGLCQQNGGTLVTLDAGITDAAIVSPHAELIRRL
jgi:toxin-antitoxin system PIN domain toxin